MRVRTIVSLSVFLLTCTIAAASAHAQGQDTASAGTKDKRVFVGLSAGASYAMVTHPLIKSDGFAAAALGLHVGVNVSERWAVGFELTTFEHGMARTSGTDPFTPTSLISPQAGCDKCEPPPPGGWISQTTATFSSIGPRVEFAPFGRDGLYLGVTTGLGVILGIEPESQFGFGGGARAGYRYRIANVLGVGVEAGVQAQAYKAGTSVFPYGALVLRPYF